MLSTSQPGLQRLPGSCQVSSAEKMVDHFLTPARRREIIEDTLTPRQEKPEREEDVPVMERSSPCWENDWKCFNKVTESG